LGRKPHVAPALSLQDGVNAARLTIPKAKFDARRCERGIECLKSYQAEWNEELRTFKKTPLHDWSSHGADAFRYLAVSWREPMVIEEELSSLEKLRRDIARKPTFNDWWQRRANELEADGVELGEHDTFFNISDNTMNME